MDKCWLPAVVAQVEKKTSTMCIFTYKDSLLVNTSLSVLLLSWHHGDHIPRRKQTSLFLIFSLISDSKWIRRFLLAGWGVTKRLGTLCWAWTANPLILAPPDSLTGNLIQFSSTNLFIEQRVASPDIDFRKCHRTSLLRSVLEMIFSTFCKYSVKLFKVVLLCMFKGTLKYMEEEVVQYQLLCTDTVSILSAVWQTTFICTRWGCWPIKESPKPESTHTNSDKRKKRNPDPQFIDLTSLHNVWWLSVCRLGVLCIFNYESIKFKLAEKKQN